MMMMMMLLLCFDVFDGHSFHAIIVILIEFIIHVYTMQKCWHSCFVLFAHKVGINVVKKLLSIGNNCAIDQSVYMQKKIF
jgi:hypothetical protein